MGLHLWHMDVPRLGVQWELQLPAYTTATATQDLSGICDLHHHSSGDAWSPTHRAMPGIEPKSSWILVGFISAMPLRELLIDYLVYTSKYLSLTQPPNLSLPCFSALRVKHPVLLGRQKCSIYWFGWWLHRCIQLSKISQLLKSYILLYVNYISIKNKNIQTICLCILRESSHYCFTAFRTHNYK